MSFAGHVLDMIRRDKQNREMRNSYRKLDRNESETFMVKKSSINIKITAEELEKGPGNKKKKEKKRKEVY